MIYLKSGVEARKTD